MQTRQGNKLQRLEAVQEFLDAHVEELKAVSTTGAKKQLDRLVAELRQLVATQSGSAMAAQGATQKQEVLRRVLREDHMAPIARIAVADLPPVPEVERLRM